MKLWGEKEAVCTVKTFLKTLPLSQRSVTVSALQNQDRVTSRTTFNFK